MTAPTIAVLGAVVLIAVALLPKRRRGRAAPRVPGPSLRRLAPRERGPVPRGPAPQVRGSFPRGHVAPSAGAMVTRDRQAPLGHGRARPRQGRLVARGRLAPLDAGPLGAGPFGGAATGRVHRRSPPSRVRPPTSADASDRSRSGRRRPLGLLAVCLLGLPVGLLVGVRPAAAGVGVLVVAGTVGVRRWWRRRADARLRALRTEAAPAMIDLLGACLRAGLNPYLAICRVVERSPGTLRSELDRAVVDLRLGRSPGAALRAVAERTGLDEFRAAASALEAADRWGMGPAEALAARAEALRSRRRLEAEAEAGRAAVRLAFPLVLCFLPAFALVVVVPTVAGAVKALVP
jgi:Flp pilus assembly protein TadB